MNVKSVKKSNMTLDKLARITQHQFLIVRENMATKDDLINLKEEIRGDTVEILQKVDKIVTHFDTKEKDRAAHDALHKRITDELYHHDGLLKKIEAKI